VRRRRIEDDLAPDRIQIGPEAPFAAAAGRLEDRDGCVVRLQIRRRRHLSPQLFADRRERRRDVGDPATQGAARQVDALAQEAPFEPIQREVVDVLGDDHMGEQAFPRQRFLDRLRGRGRLDDPHVTVRAGVFEPRGFDDAQARRDILEFLGDRLADARLQVAARATLVGLGNVDLDAVARQRRRQRVATARASVAPARSPRPLPGTHFHGVGDGAGLVGQLRKRQPQLIRPDPFRFLAEQSLAEDVELMAQRCIFALRARQLLTQRRDQRLRGCEVGDVRCVRHARIIRDTRAPTSLRDPLVPAPAPRLGDLHAGEQQQQIRAAHLDWRAGRVRRPRERPTLEPFEEHPEARAIPHQDLQAVATPIAKQEEMARERIQREALAHQRGEAIDRSPEIGCACRQVDANGWREGQHGDRSALSVARTRSAGAPARTWSRSPPVSTISIAAASGSGVTSTGTNVGAGARRAGAAADNFRHQYQNVHVDMWWRRAKLAPDSPLLRHWVTRRDIRPAVRFPRITILPRGGWTQRSAHLKTGFAERLRIFQINRHSRPVPLEESGETSPSAM